MNLPLKLLLSLAAVSALLPLSYAQAETNTRFTAEQLSAAPTTDWLTNGGSLSNQRYSPLQQINRDNVADLKGLWRTHLNGSGMKANNSGAAQPIIHDGVIYISTAENDVFALNLDSGEILWEYQANLADQLSSVCCSHINRGVGFGDGKVFIGRLDTKLIALDKDNGEVLWSIQAEQPEKGFTLTSAPLYYDGMVITGFAGGEYGTRGRVKAYDANTGTLVWTFYTVPGPGEIGHETWPQDSDAWMYGGAPVWQTPAVDDELGLLYFSTGNAGPDYNGSVRPGDNLFTASMLAIDAHTGEYRWHFQQVHHDIWDYDAPNPVILFDVELNGETRKAIVEASKTGWAYILDRVTGEPLIGIVERPVPQDPRQATAATQPYPIGDSLSPQFIDIPPENVQLVNQGRIFTPFFSDGSTLTVMSPSPAGGVNWPPSALDPKRQVMYVCAAQSAMLMYGGSLIELNTPSSGEFYDGGGSKGFASPQRGIISALDMTTNELIWQYRWPESCFSGFVATAGDIVFVGRNDGRLMALDSDTGLQLWEFQTGAGMNSTVSIVEHNGSQYIVAYSAGALYASSAHGDSVWVFALDGKMEQTTAGDTQTIISTDSITVGNANQDNGKAIYTQACLPCHGKDGSGGHGGGVSLSDVALSKQDNIIQIVSAGRNDMPSFAEALTPEQIRDVSSYINDKLFASD